MLYNNNMNYLDMFIATRMNFTSTEQKDTVLQKA